MRIISHNRRLAAAIIAVSACTCSALAQTTSGPDAGGTPRNAMLSGLVDDAWAARERAQNDVIDYPDFSYDALLAAYRATSDYDARLRIKRLAREMYLDRALGTPGGFLGIAHSGRSILTDEDSRVPPFLAPVAVARVFPQMAAGDAGLRVGDLIIAVGGAAGTLDRPVSRMLTDLRDVPAGRTCRLLLIRGGRGVVYAFGGAGFDQATIAGCSFEVDRSEAARIFCGGGAVLRVTERLTPQVNTFPQLGDLLVALDGSPIDAADPLGDLAAWLALPSATQASQSDNADVPKTPADGGEPENIARSGSSAQLLRDVQLVEVEVRLGRRPLWAIRAPEEVWGVERAALDNASAAFDGWWRETFDAGGDLGGWVDADRFWRLKPVP